MALASSVADEAHELLRLLTNDVQQVSIHVRGGGDRYLTHDELETVKDALYALYCNPQPRRES